MIVVDRPGTLPNTTLPDDMNILCIILSIPLPAEDQAGDVAGVNLKLGQKDVDDDDVKIIFPLLNGNYG